MNVALKIFMHTEQRIQIEKKIRVSFGMKFVSPFEFEPEKGFKVY